MARYAQINADFFDDPDFIGWESEEKLFYLYHSITSKNLIGIYRTRDDKDTLSIGYPLQKYLKIKESVQNKVKILWEDGWIWIVGKGNKIEGEKQWKSACKLLKELPDSLKLKKMFVTKYKEKLIPHAYPIDGGCDLALPIPIPIPIPTPKLKDGETPKLKTPPLQKQITSLSIKMGSGKKYVDMSPTEREQAEAKAVVDHYNFRFKERIEANGDKPLSYGIVKQMLRGKNGYQVLGVNQLIELIDKMPMDLLNHASRFMDMVRCPAIYL